MTNAEIARVFSQLATMLEIEGANPFRVRAYREGARVIESQAEPMSSLAKTEGALEALPGIGKDLAGKIRDVATTGSTPMFDELKSKIPLEVVALTELQGLGPKRVGTLFEVLGVRNRDDLEKAATAGKLRDLPGFGEKVEQNVLKALATASQWAGRILLAGAWSVAHELAAHVERVKGVTRVDLAGSFRRRKETVGDLDILACGGHVDQVMQAFITHPSVAEVLGRGETKSSVRLTNGLQVDLRLVPEVSFGAAMLYFTGSKEHNIELRRIAIEQGMSLNEYGLTRGDQVVASRTEEDVYRALGIKWIPPELREAHGEIETARFGELPELVTVEDLRADLHMHTTRSDGRDSIATMVKAAIAKGYEYIALTEHSKALPMTYGFDAARVRQSVYEIEAARAEFPDIRILHGLEVDILADGTLDLDDETLALLDWVIVSIHSRFDMPPDAATERVMRALSNPYVDAFGHPTGRMIGSRAAMAFDMERVVDEAAHRGVLMEINASPDRLDLSDVNARLARTKGCGFVIDTDAHSVPHLDNMQFGVFQARRAGLTAHDVWNTRSWSAFRSRQVGRRMVQGLRTVEFDEPVTDVTPPPTALPAAEAAPTRETPAPVAEPVPAAAPAHEIAPAREDRRTEVVPEPVAAAKPAARRKSAGATPKKPATPRTSAAKTATSPKKPSPATPASARKAVKRPHA